MTFPKTRPDLDYSRFDPETGVQTHDSEGREIPDATPMQPPIGFNRQPSLAQQIRSMILSEKLRQAAEESGAETFEEADDFDVGDDFEDLPRSQYEANFDPMTPEERAALASQGRDVDRILTAAEQAALSPKPKKSAAAASSGGSSHQAPQVPDPQSEAEQGEA